MEQAAAAAAQGPAGRSDRLRFILLAFFISRLVILGIGYAYFYSFYPGSPPAPAGYASSQGNLTWHPLSLLDFYDTTNYLDIAHHGYSPRQAPFFPLFPLLLWAAGGTLWAGILLSNLCFLAFLWVIDALWGRHAVIAACAAPAGIFFISAYSESLFVLLSAATLLCIRRERWGWGAVFAGLAALTRPVGWTVLGAYTLYALFLAPGRRKGYIALAVGLMAAYPLYLWAALGDPLLFLHQEETRFTRKLVFPGWGLVADVGHIVRGEVPPDWAMLALFNLIGVLFLLLALRRFRGVLETDRFWLATALYTLMVLMTPITDFTYLPATHAALRYACGCATIYPAIGENRALLIAALPLQVFVTLMIAMKWFIA